MKKKKQTRISLFNKPKMTRRLLAAQFIIIKYLMCFAVVPIAANTNECWDFCDAYRAGCRVSHSLSLYWQFRIFNHTKRITTTK